MSLQLLIFLYLNIKDLFKQSVKLIPNLLKRLNKTQDELLNWMKSKGEIKRGDVWNKAKTMGIKERTLADILRKFLDLDLIKKVTHGV